MTKQFGDEQPQRVHDYPMGFYQHPNATDAQGRAEIVRLPAEPEQQAHYVRKGFRFLGVGATLEAATAARAAELEAEAARLASQAWRATREAQALVGGGDAPAHEVAPEG